MARRASRKKSETTNSHSTEVLKSVVTRFDELALELLSEKGKYMKKAQDIAERRKDLLTEAKSRGVNIKALKVELKARDYGAKIVEAREGLESEDAQHAEFIRDFLATTQFGAGAPTSAAQKRADEEALADSLDSDEGDADGNSGDGADEAPGLGDPASEDSEED